MTSEAAKEAYATRREAINALWLEYRVANQFPTTWERAVAKIELIALRESQGTLPTQDDLAGLGPTLSGGRSAAYWMQQVEFHSGPPAWFIRDHLGIGTAVNYFDTQATLRSENERRRRQFDSMLDRLKTARVVLSRTVRG